MMNHLWSMEVEKQFSTALLWFPEGYPNRWETIAEVIGVTKEMVCQRYQELLREVTEIESIQVPPPDSSANHQPPIRKNIKTWTLREHTLFLLGVQKYGKGMWKKISENVVMTRNASQVASHAQKFYIRQSERDPGVERRTSIHDFTLADISPEILNQIHSSLPSLRNHHHQHNPQIPSHPNNLMMNQLGIQIPSSLQSHHQTASSVHYLLPLNQSSPMMDQVGPQIPSDLQLQKPCLPANSQVVHQATSSGHYALPLNQLGTQRPLNQAQIHYDLPLHHHDHSLAMSHFGTQIPSTFQSRQATSLPMNHHIGTHQLPPNQAQIHYDLPQLHHHSGPINQLGTQIPWSLQSQHQATSPAVHNDLPLNQSSALATRFTNS